MSTTEKPTPERAPRPDIDASLLGRPIAGPTALGTDPHRLWNLAKTLALTDFKLTFYGSVLGYMWQLVRPLMLFGILFVVFTQVVDLGQGVPFFATALLLGIVMYGFFSDATKSAVNGLVDRESLVRKVEFPRLAVPLAVVMTALLNFALNMLPVMLFLLIQGGEPRWEWLQVPFIFAFLTLLCLGLAMLLSALYVRFRDIQPIWDVVLQALFYASPIFYPVQTIHGPHADLIVDLLLLNPFAATLEQARFALIDPDYPSVFHELGWLVLIPIGITVGVLVLGYRVFSREAPRIAELL